MEVKSFKKVVSFLLVIIFLVAFSGCSGNQNEENAAAQTKTITDMFGRQVTVPVEVNRVLTTGPVEMELVYMLAPDKLVGLSFTFYGNPPLVQQKYLELPVVGGWFGKDEGNYETFISYHPDIILCGDMESIEEKQQKFGSIPVVGVNCGNCLTDYEEPIRFLGDLLGTQTQAAELIQYYQEAMNYVQNTIQNIPQDKRVCVYYAEGQNGLNTDPAGSQHTMLIEFCGGINVAKVQLLEGYGMAQVSFEQVLAWDPDVIIIGRGSQEALYQEIMNNPVWQKVEAVNEDRVYVRPDNPLSWFDGPPGAGQILGMYWMINTLYPEETKDFDLESKVKEFYSKFFHYDLNDAELASLLSS